MATFANHESPTTQLARNLVRMHIAKELKSLNVPVPSGKKTLLGGPTLPDTPPLELPPPQKGPLKICIVGAGMAGLYIAHILDTLKIPNLSYEILESSDRVGGRCYTMSLAIPPMTTTMLGQ